MMARKCRQCQKPIPSLKDSSYMQRHGFCDLECAQGYERAANAAKRQREAAKPRTARVTARRPRKPRAGDNRAYLDWVKTLPCVLCGGPADDAHHIIGRGFGGMGLTAPDLLTMPVCRADHDIIHRQPEHWDWQYEWVVKTIARAVQEGIL